MYSSWISSGVSVSTAMRINMLLTFISFLCFSSSWMFFYALGIFRFVKMIGSKYMKKKSHVTRIYVLNYIFQKFSGFVTKNYFLVLSLIFVSIALDYLFLYSLFLPIDKHTSYLRQSLEFLFLEKYLYCTLCWANNIRYFVSFLMMIHNIMINLIIFYTTRKRYIIITFHLFIILISICLSIRNNYNNELVHEVKKTGNMVRIHYLISHHLASVNARDKDFRPVLQWAIWNENDAIVKYLIDNNANIELQSTSWDNAIEQAYFYGREDYVRYMEQNSNDR